MRGLTPVLFALVLAACNGGGATPPRSPADGTRAPETLYVAGWNRIQAYPAAGGPVVRELTGIGFYEPGGPPPCGVGCKYARIVATAASADGTLVALTLNFRHPTTYVTEFELFGRNATGPVAPQTTYGTKNIASQDPQIALVAASAQYAIVTFTDGVDLYSGSSTPSSGFTTPYQNLAGIAVDASGSFYISAQSANVVAVFAPNAPKSPAAAATPVRTMATGDAPSKVAVGADGTVYVVATAAAGGRSARVIQEFAPNSSTPRRALGPFLHNGTPLDVADLALDRDNELFVALNDQSDPAHPVQDSVLVFAPGATDATAPLRRIAAPLPPVVDVYPVLIKSISIGP